MKRLEDWWHGLLVAIALWKFAHALNRRDLKMDDKNKELKEALALVLDAASVVKKARADGHVDMADLPLLMGLIPDLLPAIEGAGAIPAELSAMDEASAADLIAFVASRYVLEDAHARDLLDAGLKASFAVYHLIKVIKA